MGAVDKYQADPEILACGINYDNGHKFRSTAIVEFGLSYKMPAEMIEDYKIPDNKKSVISQFLSLLSNIKSNHSKEAHRCQDYC
jgi:glycerol-3-phosphate O-acyltransferase / dihydroxyacetone phosphate acyltransferase